MEPSFLNMVRDLFVWALNDQAISDLQFNKKKQKKDDPPELSYMAMNRAENGQCVIDNSRTYTTIQINYSPSYPKLSIGIELAKAMHWVKIGTLENGKLGYMSGPNLRKEFPTNVVPEAVDVIKAVNNGDEMFYKIEPMCCI